MIGTTHDIMAGVTPAPRLMAWLVHRLAGSEAGCLVIETPSGSRLVHQGRAPGPQAVLVVRRWRALRMLLTGGDIGFAEAYRRGDWQSPDLVAFFAWVTANETALSSAWRGSVSSRILDRLYHARRANSRRGSRRNIAAHYDLGNAFYSAWLDRGMNYSSALYDHSNETLETAQDRKIDRALAHLDLRADQRVLEIGCGWGAVAERLGGEGRHATGITLSHEQLRYARSRLAARGTTGVDLRLIDYRDVDGAYDRIVSIEMLEAVGESYWPVFFDRLRALLRPGGRAVLQVITIEDSRFAGYRARPDFIQRYIFPGGMLPTKTLMREHVERAGLQLIGIEAFGQSYARTLAVWRSRFDAAWPQLCTMGFDDRFRAVWEYYLAYCEAGFRLGALDVGFYVIEREPDAAA